MSEVNELAGPDAVECGFIMSKGDEQLDEVRQCAIDAFQTDGAFWIGSKQQSGSEYWVLLRDSQGAFHRVRFYGPRVIEHYECPEIRVTSDGQPLCMDESLVLVDRVCKAEYSNTPLQ